MTANGAPAAAPTAPPSSTWFVNTTSAGSERASAAAFASTYASSSAAVKSCSSFGVEAFVVVEHEDRQQPAGQLGHDDACAAEVVALRVPLLADDDDVVAEAAPLARERARVDVRAGAAEEVAVPEKDPHGGRPVYVRWKYSA